jgi:hypothetical protein
MDDAYLELWSGEDPNVRGGGRPGTGRARRSVVRALGAAGLAVAGLAASACGTGNQGTTTTTVAHGPTTPTTPPPPPMLAAGLQGPVSAVPWSEVGAGWTLVQWNPGPSGSSSSIVLVDPLGGRYLVRSSAPAGAQLAGWAAAAKVGLLITNQTSASGAGTDVTVTGIDLTDGATLYTTVLDGAYALDEMSGDGTRALFTTGLNAQDTAVAELSLTSGATLHQFDLGGFGSVEYTLPAGLALVESRNGQPVQRTSLDGTTELAFPSNFSQVGAVQPFAYNGASFALYAPDGASLVLGAAEGLAYVSNDGTVISQLPVPVPAGGQGSGCSPVQWWATGVVLATCPGPAASNGAAEGSFYAVPLDGATPTRLGSADGFVGPMYQIGNGVYGQVEACGTQSVGEVGPSSYSAVPVPGLKANSQHIVTAVGDRIEVLGEPGCQPGGATGYSLVWVDPLTGHTTFLLGPPITGGSVDQAVPYEP